MSYRTVFPLMFAGLLTVTGLNAQGPPGGGPGTGGGGTGGTAGGGTGGGVVGGTGVRSSAPGFRSVAGLGGSPKWRYLCPSIVVDGPGDDHPEGGSPAGSETCAWKDLCVTADDCTTCSGGPPVGGKNTPPSDVNFGLSRRFLPQNQAFYSSFAPGNFSNFDTKFYVYENAEGGNAVQLYDAQSGAVFEMLDGVGSESLDGEFSDVRNKVLRKLVLNDSTGNPTTSLAAAVTAALGDWRGVKTEFGLINLSTDPLVPDYAGRITKVIGPRGYTLTVSYRDALAAGSGGFTAQELIDAPDRRFQIHQVVDYQGDTATFEYGTTQVGGRWAVSRVVLPDNTDVDYAYVNDRLDKVTFVDGSETIFVYGQDQIAQTVTVAVYNAHSGVAPRKYHLTNDYMTLGTDVINQPQGILRMIEDDNSEVRLMLVPDDTDPNQYLTYTGSSKASEVVHGASVRFYEDGWDFAPIITGGDPVIDGDLEPTYGSAVGATPVQLYTGTVQQWTDEAGRTFSYEYDADTFLTKKTWDGDGTYEEYEYDVDKNVTRMRDRVGRVMKYEYDASGNVTKAMVGILEVNGTDLNQPEYSEQVNEYYASAHVSKGLLKTAYSAVYDHATSSTDMHRTDYEYDARGNVTKMLESAAHPGEDRPEWTYTYDDKDRKLTQVDPLGHTLSYLYDDQDRIVRKAFDDASTEEWMYGAPGTGDEHLLLAYKDRKNTVTEYEHDLSGRQILRKMGVATDANILDRMPHGSPISQLNEQSVTSYTYLAGTSLTVSVSQNGRATDTTWDYRHRNIQTVTYPAEGRALYRMKSYVDNSLFSLTEPNGHTLYYGYRDSDAQIIRVVYASSDVVTLASQSEVMTVGRDSAVNAPLRVYDTLKDSTGQITTLIDARGFQSLCEFDSYGREVTRVSAVNTPVESRHEFAYDAEGRTSQTRTPRFFDDTDLNGYMRCMTSMTYDGRGNLWETTSATGSPESWTIKREYGLLNRVAETRDPDGHEWALTYLSCCGRGFLTSDPFGHGSITNSDAVGRVTHTAKVASVLSHTPNDPTDATTLEEVTTRFSALGTTVASTRWLVPLGHVSAESPPIAGLDGTPKEAGLTTRRIYDSDLTDGVGLDSVAGITIDQLGVGTGGYSVTLSSALAKLAQPEADGGADLTFGTGCASSATLTVNAEEELAFVIRDGARREVMQGLLSPHYSSNPNSLFRWTCTVHDGSHQHASYGTLIEVRTVDALGSVRCARRDRLGRDIERVDENGGVTEFTYDAMGNLRSVRDPNGVGQDCVYDELGRVIACTDTTNATRQYGYDKEGNLVLTMDAKGESSSNSFDATNRLILKTDRLGHATQYTYNKSGDTTEIEDAEGSTTRYVYDMSGRKLSETHPGHVGQSSLGTANYDTVTFLRDAMGRIVSRQDQQGDLITYSFDLAGRMLSREYDGYIGGPLDGSSEIDSFAYDGEDRTVMAIKGRYGNTITRTFNEAGECTSEALTAAGQSYTVATSFDARGDIATITYPNGIVVDRAYNTRGQLEEVGLTKPTSSRHAVATFAYDDGRREILRTLGNGIEVARSYTSASHLSSIEAAGIESRSYTYDENGNKKSESITGPLSGYGFSAPQASGYDEEDRLQSVDRVNTSLSRTWDLSPTGNWNSLTTNGVSQTRTHNLGHELKAIDGDVVSYDTKGNVTHLPVQLTGGTSELTLEWDFDNQLMASSRGLVETSYTYDAFGRRVSVGNRLYVSRGEQVLVEYNVGEPASNGAASYIYGTYVDEPLARVNGSVSYFHRDQQYSITAISDSAGDVLERYTYNSHGAIQVHSPAGTLRTESLIGNRVAYTGREFDSESGLQYFRARYYSGNAGRFLSRDPKQFVDGMNQYRNYFALTHTDPSGTLVFAPCLVGGAVGAAIGALGGWFDAERNHQGECQRNGKTKSGLFVGAFSGCLATQFPGLGSCLVSAFAGGIQALINQMIDKTCTGCPFDEEFAFCSMMAGFLSGGIGCGLGAKGLLSDSEFVRQMAGLFGSIIGNLGGQISDNLCGFLHK